MPSFKTVTMKNTKGQEYQIDLSLNDAAIMDSHLEIEVTGRYRRNDSEQWEEKIFIVRLVSSQNKIQVIFHSKVIGEIDLRRFEGALDETFDKLDASDAWNQVREFFLDNGEIVEQAIQRIPAFDPVFGCLLKSGLSTAIGQLLECYPQVRALANPLHRVWATLRCLGVNSFVMASKFTLRTLKCAALGGWDIV